MKYILRLLLALLILTAGYVLFPEPQLPEGASIDKIFVEKGARKMHVFQGEKLLKTYTISLGFAPKGEKQFEGDGKTPEGTYRIDSKNPNSGYHLNLGVSYPSIQQRNYAEKLGKSAGGDIKIHGMTNGLGFIGKFHRWIDWTHGCIAITNAEIEELYQHTAVGATIEIVE